MFNAVFFCCFFSFVPPDGTSQDSLEANTITHIIIFVTSLQNYLGGWIMLWVIGNIL